MPRQKTRKEKELDQYDHKEQERLNNPPIGLVTPDTDQHAPKTTYRYDPHFDPRLNWDGRKLRDEFEMALRAAVEEGDQEKRKELLEPLLTASGPWLEWTGKAERTNFDVDTVSLHVHERIDPHRIIRQLRKDETAQTQLDFFFDSAENNPPLREAIEFYKHKMNWTNRLIAGDSLLVMNSLLEKEGMAGKVQMVYIDPPYGVKYGSNFQPFVNKRDVKDGKDEDLTQEPEMVKAYRDTWELGIHSYLSYLRDRLLLTRELLTNSGSVFVQISDENVHHIREIMDEVFGAGNFVSLVFFAKTTGQASKLLPSSGDFILWFAKDKHKIKYRQLFFEKVNVNLPSYCFVESSDGSHWRRMDKNEMADNTSIPKGWQIFSAQNLRSQGYSKNSTCIFEYQGTEYYCGDNHHWKTTPKGMNRLATINRLISLGNNINYKRYVKDYPIVSLNDRWDDTAIAGFSGEEKVYVVQTAKRVIERCLLMTTDPGDLVLDPTCGSGTTAYVAEKWGRRWLTIDTSRVAITLAKQRLMTPVFDYYTLAHPDEGVGSGFVYRSVPHITLKSIANNEEIDYIHNRWHPKIEEALNEFLTRSGLDFREWEVPLGWNETWNKVGEWHFHEFWRLKKTMQEEMDKSIQRLAPQETLYDQPELDKSKVRVTGPFTVESVPAPMVKPIDEIETEMVGEADASVVREGESLRVHQWLDELLRTGIRAKAGRMITFSRLEPLPGTRWLHADGETKDDGKRVVVSFGPTYAPLEKRQVERAVQEAQKLVPRPELVIFASFHFDPEAAKDIDETNWPGVSLLKVQMNTDLLTEDLKKKRASNESYWLIGQPDVELRNLKDGAYELELHGFDYYNPVTGNIEAGGTDKIALWMLDTDYDGRSIYPTQIFFPMAGEKDGWARLGKTLKAQIDEEKIEKFRGTVSLPFEVGENNRIAVKIVDDRGIESLKVLEVN